MTSHSTSRPVCLLVPLLDGGGGIERATFRLAEGLVRAGQPVDLVLFDRDDPPGLAVPPGVTRLHVGARRTMEAVPWLVRYLRRRRPRALVGAMPLANLVALVSARLARSRTHVVVTEHNDLHSMWGQAASRKERVLLRLVGALYPRADAVVAVSHGLGDRLAALTRLPRSAVAVIHDPVVTPDFHDRAARPAAHPWLDEDGPVVVSVGRLAPQKGHDVLIDAFARVRRHRDARLIIVGEGGQRQALQRRVDHLGLTDDVHLAGYLADPLPLVARASVFALASRYEGLGNALIEALALGRPIVAADCPCGPAEILADGRYGDLVPVGAVRELAEALLARLERGGDLAPEHAWTRFRSEVVADAYLDLLDTLG